MCGILGIVAPPGGSVRLDGRRTGVMRDAMQARGPDACGSFRRRNVVFEHRRLAIRDLAGGAQPWVSDDGECVLVYNGELYNDGLLRRELTARGHRFRSHGDTEVVMAAWLEWGPACVEHFRGMFALAIYDFRDDSLLLARDRFGIKPLFVAEIDGTLVFASSIAPLLKHPAFVHRPHWPAVSHYLTTLRLTLGRQTLFEGVRQLLPGERLVCQAGRTRIERYWDYPAGEDEALDEEMAAADLHAGLRHAVEMQLVSDVPVGMFLSGGVDSSTLACLVRDLSPRPMLGQCGGGDGPSDDFEHARLCAEHAGFDYGEVRVGPDDYFDCWEWMLGQYATPVSTPTDVVIYQLAREMKKSVGVVLGGEGADELLCGYAVAHWAGRDYELSRQLETDRWPGTAAAARMFRASLRRQYGRDRFLSDADHYFALNSLVPTAVKPALLMPRAWEAAGRDRPMHDRYAALFAECPNEPPLRRHARVLHRVNLEALLSRLDSATMLAGLEARVPYTDHPLVEAMFRAPQRFKIDVVESEQAPWLASGELERRGSLRSKRLLRTVAGQLMPAALAHRRKASFPTPVETWLSGRWAGRVRDRLRESPFGREHFQPHALSEIADNLPQAGMWPWPLLNVLAWGDRVFG